MPTWMWLNIPLLILVFAAVVGISYWLVIRHPDEKAAATFDPAPGTKAPAAPEPARAEPATAESAVPEPATAESAVPEPATAESAPRKAEVPAQGRREAGHERRRGPRSPLTTGRR
jgi:hypothetical protein